MLKTREDGCNRGTPLFPVGMRHATTAEVGWLSATQRKKKRRQGINVSYITIVGS